MLKADEVMPQKFLDKGLFAVLSVMSSFDFNKSLHQFGGNYHFPN